MNFFILGGLFSGGFSSPDPLGPHLRGRKERTRPLSGTSVWRPPIALHSVAHRVSQQILQNQRCRAKIALHPPKSRCRTFLWTPPSHFPLIRSRQGAKRADGGYRENGLCYRGVSRLQSHRSRYSVQLSTTITKGNNLENLAGNRRTFQACGRYKTLSKPKKPYRPPILSSVEPCFFRPSKVPHWSKVVWGFFSQHLKLGVSQRPLTLVLLQQKYRDRNGSRIMIQII